MRFFVNLARSAVPSNLNHLLRGSDGPTPAMATAEMQQSIQSGFVPVVEVQIGYERIWELSSYRIRESDRDLGWIGASECKSVRLVVKTARTGERNLDPVVRTKRAEIRRAEIVESNGDHIDQYTHGNAAEDSGDQTLAISCHVSSRTSGDARMT